MTLLSILVYLCLVLLSGAALAGVINVRLGFGTRLAISMVLGLVLSSFVCYSFSLVIGFTVLSAVLAPVVITIIGVLLTPGWISKRWVDEARMWQAELRAGRLWTALIPFGIYTAGMWVFFSRVLTFDAAGNLVTGYWVPDWAQHLTTLSSFVNSQNLPPQNPIFAGDPLYYPFLPDFSAAVFTLFGAGVGTALELPQALLCICIGVLIVSFAERLGAHQAAGMVTVVICLIGGGLGFVGAFQDSCTQAGIDASQCTFTSIVTHPLTGANVAAVSVRNLPTIVKEQPRQYDGNPALQTSGNPPVFDNQQWYTPLYAWWLPQRSFVYGFATALVILILLQAILIDREKSMAGLLLCGVLGGILPFIHVHTLFALILIGAVWWMFHRSRNWLIPAISGAVLAAPRMLMLATGPKGSADLGNQYPWIEPGWQAMVNSKGWLAEMYHATGSPHNFSVSVGEVISEVLRLPFTGAFWWFWWVNLGVAVPLCALVCVALLTRFLPRSGRVMQHRFTHRLRRPFDLLVELYPPNLLHFFLATMLIFLVANVVVFQSWDWDNTKVFAYWYFGASLLISVLIVEWLREWRGKWGRALAAAVLGVSVLLTGAICSLRLVAFEPNCGEPNATPGHCYLYGINGPYTLVSADDRNVALTVLKKTAPRSVFLTSTQFDDPITNITGRPAVMGYTGWLGSYGIDYLQRQDDVNTALGGCGRTPLQSCDAIIAILHRYNISYVEINVDSQSPKPDYAWWSGQNLPVVARDSHLVIYDVRGH